MAQPPMKQNCADGQVPEWDYYGVHDNVSLEDAQKHFESCGYRVIKIARIGSACNCNEARNDVMRSWEDCKCSHWHYDGNYDWRLGNACQIYAFNGEYRGEHQDAPGPSEQPGPWPGYGRAV